MWPLFGDATETYHWARTVTLLCLPAIGWLVGLKKKWLSIIDKKKPFTCPLSLGLATNLNGTLFFSLSVSWLGWWGGPGFIVSQAEAGAPPPKPLTWSQTARRVAILIAKMWFMLMEWGLEYHVTYLDVTSSFIQKTLIHHAGYDESHQINVLQSYLENTI